MSNEEIFTEIMNQRSASEVPPENLWHYTDVRGALGIIENQSLWATSFQHLNDPHEFRYGLDLVTNEIRNFAWQFIAKQTDLIKAVADFIDSEAPNPKLHFYITSLSEAFDLRSQWINYANNGGGLSLGFNAKDLPTGEFIRIYKVIYDRASQISQIQKLLQEFDASVIQIINANGPLLAPQIRNFVLCLWQSSYLLSTRFKHQQWAPEQEWRLVVFEQDANLKFRTRGVDIVPFTTINLQSGLKSLVQLQLGPGLSDKDENAMRVLKNTKGLRCSILRSFATIV